MCYNRIFKKSRVHTTQARQGNFILFFLSERGTFFVVVFFFFFLSSKNTTFIGTIIEQLCI